MLFIEQIRMQPAHDAPNLAAEPNHLLTLP